MVKGQREEAFCTIPDKCMELQGYLDEGLFTKSTTIGDYGTGQNSYVPVTASKLCVVGTPVKRKAGADRTFEKASDNDFDAVIRADPEGIPPVEATDDKRQALLEFPLVGFNYHIPLADDNSAIEAGDTVGWTGTKWDKVSDPVGFIFIAVEGATANSGKYIDAYLKQITFEVETGEGG